MYNKKEGKSVKKTTQQKIIAVMALIMAAMMILPMIVNIFVY